MVGMEDAAFSPVRLTNSGAHLMALRGVDLGEIEYEMRYMRWEDHG
jgi:hypothetical protein